MDDAKIQVQNQPDPVTVTKSGVEGEPAKITPDLITEAEMVSEIQESEPAPELDEEVERSGVSVVSDKPVIHSDAKAKGLDHSIPEIPKNNYDIDLSNKEKAREGFATGNIYFAKPWRSLIALKNIAKQLLSVNRL